MLLSTFKPTLRKLGATALIVLTTMVYGALSTALTKETQKQMTQALHEEPLASQMQEMSEIPCERDRKMMELNISISEKNSGKMLPTRNQWLTINFFVLFFCAYMSACLILRNKEPELAI